MRNPMAWSAGFLIAGSYFAGRAIAHSRELAMFGPICGDASQHCAWCYAAAASLAAAATLWALSLDRPVPAAPTV